MNSNSLAMRIRHRRRSAGRSQRYPEDLRREILVEVQSRRARGEGLVAVAQRLGLSPWTIYAWLRDGRGERRRGFRRVELVPSPAVRAVLVTPAGYRLEGDAESLAAVLKVLS